jgi:hypothetical protein
MRSPFIEERQVGVELLYLARRELPDQILGPIVVVFDDVVRDWGPAMGCPLESKLWASAPA